MEVETVIMRKHTLIWLAGKIRDKIPSILVMTVMQVAHALFCVFLALGSRAVIDNAVAGDVSGFVRSCLTQGGIIAGILLSLTLLRHLREKLRADLEKVWKQRLLHGLIHGEYAEVADYHSAELLNRLNNDVTKVDDGVLSVVPGAMAMLSRIVASVVILGTLDARFAVGVTLVGVALILGTGFVRQRLKDLNKQVSQLDGKVSGFLQETIEKLLVVQAMDISYEIEGRMNHWLDERYDVQRRRKNVSLTVNTGVSFVFYAAGFVALCWCAGRMLQGEMTFGSLTAVTQLISQLQSPFVNLSGILPQYVAMAASAERLMELENIQGEPEPMLEDPQEVYQQMVCLRAEKLDFAFDREVIFHNADFMLPKGAFAVITGPSGIGKSTLLKLVLGIFRPSGGNLSLVCGKAPILLDRSTRRLFAYVPQGNLLFSGTIRENLTVIKPDATEEEIMRAVETSAMDEFLHTFPQGLDTVLGESGSGLSEGQAQRLAIARAVLGGAPILLLDECTSALDAETEATVLRRLRSLPDRMCIAVTHRPAAIALCDCQMEVVGNKIVVKVQTHNSANTGEPV